MLRINRTIELTLIVGIGPFVSGQTASTVHQTATRSSCSNIVALAGAKVDCSSLTPSQKKALENIPAILKMALSNQNYLDAIMAKLDEISKAESPVQQTVNAPNGIGAIGGTLINPQVNNFRNPIPEIESTQSFPISPQPKPQPTDSPQRPLRPGTLQNRGAQVIVTVKGVFYNPAFLVDCSVPCRFSTLFVEGNGVETSNSTDFQGLSNENHTVAGVAYSKQLYPGSRLRLVFESLDDRVLSVSNVRPYSP